jgi:hypothetical protein
VKSELREFDCPAPKRVLIRIRAVTRGSASLRERTAGLVSTGTPITRAEWAVRTPAGKTLAYAAVDASGRSALYTAKSCDQE